MENLNLRVSVTNNRPNLHGEFFAKVHPDLFRAIKQGQFIVLHNNIDGRDFTIQSVLYKDAEIRKDEIRLDQKLRHAIGANTGDYISTSIQPDLNKGAFINWIRTFFGVQVNLARVKCATFNDMEIRICRISKEVMKSIGVYEGDTIKVQSPSATIKIRALELTKENQFEILDGEKNYPSNYPDCFAVMKRERFDVKKIDLPLILIDSDTRKQLGISECDPVRVCRSIQFTISQKMHLISLPIILATVGALFSFNWSALLKLSVLLTSLAIVIFLNLFEIREKVGN